MHSVQELCVPLDHPDLCTEHGSLSRRRVVLLLSDQQAKTLKSGPQSDHVRSCVYVGKAVVLEIFWNVCARNGRWRFVSQGRCCDIGTSSGMGIVRPRYWGSKEITWWRRWWHGRPVRSDISVAIAEVRAWR